MNAVCLFTTLSLQQYFRCVQWSQLSISHFAHLLKTNETVSKFFLSEWVANKAFIFIIRISVRVTWQIQDFNFIHILTRRFPVLFGITWTFAFIFFSLFLLRFVRGKESFLLSQFHWRLAFVFLADNSLFAIQFVALLLFPTYRTIDIVLFYDCYSCCFFPSMKVVCFCKEKKLDFDLLR